MDAVIENIREIYRKKADEYNSRGRTRFLRWFLLGILVVGALVALSKLLAP